MTDTGSIPIYAALGQDRSHDGQVVPISPPRANPAPAAPVWVPATGWHEASRRALLAHHAALQVIDAKGHEAERSIARFVLEHQFPTRTDQDTTDLGDVALADMVRGLGAAMTQIAGQS